MLMEMWVVLKSLSPEVSAAMWLGYLWIHIMIVLSGREADVVISLPVVWRSPPKRDEVTWLTLLEFHSAEPALPFTESSPTTTTTTPISPSPPRSFHCLHTHTHTDAGSRRAARWMTARSLPAKSGLKGTAIHQPRAWICELVCVLSYRVWLERWYQLLIMRKSTK